MSSNLPVKNRFMQSNQGMELTAGRPDAPLYLMKTRPLQATLAFASGS